MLGLIGTIAGETFSPLNEQVKDWFSPPPNAIITSAVVFDPTSENNKKIIKSGAESSSPSITFEFGAFNEKKQMVDHWSFECSFDGAPFEPCLSPKPYGDLASELTHIFQVRHKGILGNVGKIPDKFNVTTVTSSLVEGIFVPNTWVSIDKAINSKTDNRGGFFFDDVKRGPHYLELYLDNSTLPYYIIFPVQQGTNWKDLGVMSVNNLFRVNSTSNVNSSTVDDKLGNPEFKPASQTEIPIKVGLLQEAKKINKNYFAKISLNATNETLLKIDKVQYFLHPTFHPSVINSTNPQDGFAISFTGWGFFNLKAKVYFKDGNIQDLSLPLDKWKLTL